LGDLCCGEGARAVAGDGVGGGRRSRRASVNVNGRGPHRGLDRGLGNRDKRRVHVVRSLLYLASISRRMTFLSAAASASYTSKGPSSSTPPPPTPPPPPPEAVAVAVAAAAGSEWVCTYKAVSRCKIVNAGGEIGVSQSGSDENETTRG
jgi:hypothetical protein